MSDFVVTPSEDNGNPDDVMSAIAANGDAAPYRCEVCGMALHYGGRGRPPVRCDEHKKQRASSNGSNPKRPSGVGMKVLEEQLADMYRFVGMGLSMVDQFDGMTIAASADNLAHSWVVAAETNPKLKKFLIKLTTGTGVGGVILAHALVAFPIMEHHKMLPQFLQKTA
jgi:hypothetical protein